MRIGLIDVDSHNFPNLPLMKNSAWHKLHGDVVEWYEPLVHVFDSYICDGQTNLFEMDKPKFQIINPLRLIELFAGVGSQAMAVRDLGVNFEHYRVVEFDKYAINSYNAIHGTHFPTMDIKTITGEDLGIVDTENFTYLLTYSFPCQDLSVAGKGAGMSKGSGTRSGLLWEVERLLDEVDNLPQVLLMENVPQVHGKKNIEDFRKWIQFLEEKGYSNYWQDLNAKNFGIAQNRNRCFMVSILGNYNYEFPNEIPLTKTMKDYLEEKVDEKYYINKEKTQKLIDKLINDGTICQTRPDQTRLAWISPLISRNQSVPQTVLKQDMMQELAISNQMAAVLSNQGTEFEKFTDIANALMARDYKGFGNQGMNGVIECKKEK